MLEPLMPSLDAHMIVLGGVVLVVAGAVQGSTGFGFGLLAAPLLALIDPVFVPGPMLLMGMIISFGAALRERELADVRGLGFALTGRILFSVLAVLMFGKLTEAQFDALFAAMLLLAVALSLVGWRVAPTSSNLFIAGSVSGFMGTLTSIGAPPMALVYQNVKGPVMRATLSLFFMVGAAVSVIALWAFGQLPPSDLVLAGMMLPFALVGLLLSNWGRRVLDRGRVKPIVLATTAFTGIFMIARHVWA
jgi:uncharacterized membrane protein YfcA